MRTDEPSAHEKEYGEAAVSTWRSNAKETDRWFSWRVCEKRCSETNINSFSYRLKLTSHLFSTPTHRSSAPRKFWFRMLHEPKHRTKFRHKLIQQYRKQKHRPHQNKRLPHRDNWNRHIQEECHFRFKRAPSSKQHATSILTTKPTAIKTWTQ